ncbi:MAG: hypothetical protein EOO01_25970 [Chitinophagaceae bacterium]|nr:MAG: hypothetical protein EOO01_25970 [Chitinophagaceae bacterium]
MHYLITRKTNELYAAVFADLYGMKVIGFRYFNVFGSRQDPDGPYAAVLNSATRSSLRRAFSFYLRRRTRRKAGAII